MPPRKSYILKMFPCLLLFFAVCDILLWKMHGGLDDV